MRTMELLAGPIGFFVAATVVLAIAFNHLFLG